LRASFLGVLFVLCAGDQVMIFRYINNVSFVVRIKYQSSVNRDRVRIACFFRVLRVDTRGALVYFVPLESREAAYGADSHTSTRFTDASEFCFGIHGY